MSLATMHIMDTDDSVKLSRKTVAVISSRRECSNNFQMLHLSEENVTRIWWFMNASNGFSSLKNDVQKLSRPSTVCHTLEELRHSQNTYPQ